MYAGQIVETGPVEEIFERPRMPYTAGLIASIPALDPECAYGMLFGDAKGVMPITHEAYEVIIEARKLKSK